MAGEIDIDTRTLRKKELGENPFLLQEFLEYNEIIKVDPQVYFGGGTQNNYNSCINIGNNNTYNAQEMSKDLLNFIQAAVDEKIKRDKR
jgi:hypothetical protein